VASLRLVASGGQAAAPGGGKVFDLDHGYLGGFAL